MVEYKIYRILFIVLLCCFCCSCDKSESINTFQRTFEKYNDDYLTLDLADASFFQESNASEVNEIIKGGTGVIFIGSPTDNVSRRVVSILLDVASNSDLNKIYYLDSLDGVDGLDDNISKVPVVLFVLDGSIVDYHVGTISDKVDLTDEETIELYNLYLEGVHKVLQDACDESC